MVLHYWIELHWGYHRIKQVDSQDTPLVSTPELVTVGCGGLVVDIAEFALVDVSAQANTYNRHVYRYYNVTKMYDTCSSCLWLDIGIFITAVSSGLLDRAACIHSCICRNECICTQPAILS